MIKDYYVSMVWVVKCICKIRIEFFDYVFQGLNCVFSCYNFNYILYNRNQSIMMGGYDILNGQVKFLFYKYKVFFRSQDFIE